MAGDIYLIDFENMGNRWADLLSGASEGDTAYLFYSDNSPKAMLDQLERAERQGIALKFRRCGAGRNGLDFQLVSELGFLAGRGAGRDYYIISEDAGYDVLSDYWAQAGVRVVRIGPVRPADEPCVDTREDEHRPFDRVTAWLDAPMTRMGLSKYERAHVLGCARACVETLSDPAARMAKFRSDTCRIKGKKLWERLDAGLGAALDGLFRA